MLDGATPRTACDETAFAAAVVDRLQKFRAEISEIAGNVDDVSAFLADQMKRFQQLSDVANQMAAAIAAIDAASRETDDVSRTASDQSGRSLATVENAIGSIRGLADSVRAIQSSLGELDTHLASVGSSTRDIQTIARQTNLLALNATIESERAGAAGKGFAVVANEVKSLARKAGEVTHGIEGSVESLTGSIADLIATTGETVATAGHVSDGVGVISETIQGFGAALDQIHAKVGEISEAATEGKSQCEDVIDYIDTFMISLSTTGETLDEARGSIRGLVDRAGDAVQFAAARAKP